MNNKREERVILQRLECVPSGLKHMMMIDEFGQKNRILSVPLMGEHKERFVVVGISLSIIYQIATCHRVCFGGDHVVESLCGRAYNLACSVFTLMCRGLYDEALSLIRSMGELANLIGLLFNDKEARKLWLQSNKKERLNKFSPARVRESLVNLEGGIFLFADRDWYSRLSEEYIHVHPGTRPNVHNDQARANAGGSVQEEGFRTVIRELTLVCSFIALFVSQYGGLKDLFGNLTEALNDLKDD